MDNILQKKMDALGGGDVIALERERLKDDIKRLADQRVLATTQRGAALEQLTKTQEQAVRIKRGITFLDTRTAQIERVLQSRQRALFELDFNLPVFDQRTTSA